jgi:hypothetical protein
MGGFVAGHSAAERPAAVRLLEHDFGHIAFSILADLAFDMPFAVEDRDLRGNVGMPGDAAAGAHELDVAAAADDMAVDADVATGTGSRFVMDFELRRRIAGRQRQCRQRQGRKHGQFTCERHCEPSF